MHVPRSGWRKLSSSWLLQSVSSRHGNLKKAEWVMKVTLWPTWQSVWWDEAYKPCAVSNNLSSVIFSLHKTQNVNLRTTTVLCLCELFQWNLQKRWVRPPVDSTAGCNHRSYGHTHTQQWRSGSWWEFFILSTMVLVVLKHCQLLIYFPLHSAGGL